MPLFSTIAHTGAPSARQGIPRKRKVIRAALIAVALTGLGLTASVFEAQPSSPKAPSTAGFLSHDEFVRINTVELPVLESSPSGDVTRGYPVPHGNGTAVEESRRPAVAERALDADMAAFIEVNTTALDHLTGVYMEPETGPR